MSRSQSHRPSWRPNRSFSASRASHRLTSFLPRRRGSRRVRPYSELHSPAVESRSELVTKPETKPKTRTPLSPETKFALSPDTKQQQRTQ